MLSDLQKGWPVYWAGMYYPVPEQPEPFACRKWDHSLGKPCRDENGCEYPCDPKCPCCNADQETVKMAEKIIRSLSSDQRTDIFRMFCIHCGSNDSNCQCMNDE